jgi:hypothetical protein
LQDTYRQNAMAQPSKEAQLRAERLAKALRANLGRRKSQARQRDVASTAKPADDATVGDAQKTQDPTG